MTEGAAGMTRRDCLLSLAGAAALGGCRSLVDVFGAGWKLSLNPSTVRDFKLPFAEQVRLAAATGWNGIEPWLKDLWAAKRDGSLKDAVARARDAGLAFVNGIAFGSWAADDPAARAKGLEETRRDMELLAEIGCPLVAASMFGVHKPGARKLRAEEIAERYAAVLDLGRRTGVRPLLEYWGHSANLSRPEDAVAVLRLLNRDDAAVLPDVFHTWKGGGDFAALAALCPSELPVLHVNDFPVGAERAKTTDADRVWPGDGGADWPQVFATLAASGVRPWLSLELFNASYQAATPEWTLRTGLAKTRSVIS